MTPAEADREKIAVDSIRKAIEEMQSLVRVIRDSYSLDRNHRLPSEFMTDDGRDFEKYALATVKCVFPHDHRSATIWRPWLRFDESVCFARSISRGNMGGVPSTFLPLALCRNIEPRIPPARTLETR
jgi:hypothetical protein